MRSIWALDDKLRDKGIKTFYLLPFQAKELSWIKEVENFGKHNTIYYKNGRKIHDVRLMIQIIKRHNVGIIHTHFGGIKDILLTKLLKIVKPSLMDIIHHHNHYNKSNSAFKEVLKKIVMHGSIHIACSKDVSVNLIESGFKQKTVYTAENAIDFTRLDNYEPVAKESLGIKGDDKMFLMFGFDYLRKGVDIVVHAMQPLAGDKKIVLGIVLSTNKELVKGRLTEILGGSIPDWIKLLPPRDDIATYYKIADCFISASREEGFCYSVIEAIYAGCQTIQSKIRGHRFDIPNCKIFESESIDGLRECILGILNESRKIKEEINAEQKDYVIKKYRLDNWVDKIIDVYKGLIQNE